MPFMIHRKFSSSKKIACALGLHRDRGRVQRRGHPRSKETISQTRGRHPWLQRETRNTILVMRGIHHRAGLAIQGALYSLRRAPCARMPLQGSACLASDSRSHHGSHNTLPTAQQRILVWGDAAADRCGRGVAYLPSLLCLSSRRRATSSPATQASRRFSDRKVALSVAGDLKVDDGAVSGA